MKLKGLSSEAIKRIAKVVRGQEEDTDFQENVYGFVADFLKSVGAVLWRTLPVRSDDLLTRDDLIDYLLFELDELFQQELVEGSFNPIGVAETIKSFLEADHDISLDVDQIDQVVRDEASSLKQVVEEMRESW